MVDLAKEAFSTNNFNLAAEIYERTIRENGPTSELFLGLADSLARGGSFTRAFESYTNAYRYGKVTPERLKHLVACLIDTVKQEPSSGNTPAKKNCMFSCGSCRGLLEDPVTIPCGHTFCRKCLNRDVSKTCDICNTIHYHLRVRQLSSNVVLTNLIEKWFPGECRAYQLKKEGNALCSKLDFINAIDVYSKAINIAPSDHLLLSNRCHAYASVDQFLNALKDAERVVQLRPDWPKGYFRKGTALYGLGHYEDSAVAFLQCLALDQKISSAKEYLSKALDKILNALPPDDPKAYLRAQQSNPSLLHQLLESNFSQCGSLLLPQGQNLQGTFTDLERIVRDTITTANNFTSEPQPQRQQQLASKAASHEDVRTASATPMGGAMEESDSFMEEEPMFPSIKTRYNSMPDCSRVDHAQLEQQTLPRSHSPLCRKRARLPSSCSAPCPASPTHQSPNKVLRSTALKSTTLQGASSSADNAAATPLAATSSQTQQIQPQHTDIEDVECGLCYRLFHEPVTTPCGHSFCRKCLDRCLDHTVTCPMCKGNLADYLAERRQSVTDALQAIIEHYFKDEYVERCKANDEEMIELSKMGSELESEIPVFVCTLAFPTIRCPLHIFEPRYRLMVRQCMESGTRQFGMCIQTNDENGFSEYGTMLEIRDVQYFPDGRSVVDTIGGRRFKVLSRGMREGYNTAKVEFIQDIPPEAGDLQALNDLQTELHGALRRWLESLPTVSRARISQHLGDLPALDLQAGSWAWWAFAVLPLDPNIQLAMIRMPVLKDRLLALRKVLTYINRRSSR